MSTDAFRQAKKALFLTAYAHCGTIVQAAKDAEIHRDTHYAWMKDDPEYVIAFRAAHEDAIQNLEAEARRRAFAGSDTLLIFMLKAARPSVYRERIEMHVNLDDIAETLGEAAGLSRDEIMAEADRILSGER